MIAATMRPLRPSLSRWKYATAKMAMAIIWIWDRGNRADGTAAGVSMGAGDGPVIIAIMLYCILRFLISGKLYGLIMGHFTNRITGGHIS